jgi:cell division protein FtsQ
MLPEGAEVQALAKLAELQASHQLLDRPLQVVDLRLPDRLVVRAQNGAPTTDKPADPKADSAHPVARRPT